jgi:glycine C-acetyltransferase
VVELLRQRSRPYLFSNTLAPSVAGASIKVFDLLEGTSSLLDALRANTAFFRTEMTSLGFSIRPGSHPIVVRPSAVLDFSDCKLVCSSWS